MHAAEDDQEQVGGYCAQAAGSEMRNYMYQARCRPGCNILVNLSTDPA